MKHLLVGLLMLVTAGNISCDKADQVDPELNPLKEHTKDLAQANTFLVGTWKLTKVYAQVPNLPVPNVKLVIDQHQIKLIRDDTQTDKVDFNLTKTDSSLLLQTNAQPQEDNWYVRSSSLYINRKRMLLDAGMAQDLPAYIFDKVE
jgi:hypothetical protein